MRRVARLFKKVKRRIYPVDGRTLLSERLSRKLDFGGNYEDEAFEAMQVVKNNTMLPYGQLASLYEQVVYCEKNNIRGSFVECGVWKAGAAGLMALASQKYGKATRDLYLFDAYDDICEPDESHDEKKLVEEVKKIVRPSAGKDFRGGLKPLSGIYDKWGGYGTLQEAKHLLEEKIRYPQAHLFYVKGWFQETVPVWKEQIEDIAILRLDGDWYDSTRVCLEALYPKLVRGGVCIIDDYGYNTGCRKAVHEYLEKQDENPLLNKVEHLRYWIKS